MCHEGCLVTEEGRQTLAQFGADCPHPGFASVAWSRCVARVADLTPASPPLSSKANHYPQIGGRLLRGTGVVW